MHHPLPVNIHKCLAKRARDGDKGRGVGGVFAHPHRSRRRRQHSRPPPLYTFHRAASTAAAAAADAAEAGKSAHADNQGLTFTCFQPDLSTM